MRPNWFVGIPVEIPQLQLLLKDLPKTCRGFHPDDLHMTIAFLGALEPDRVEPVKACMASMKATPTSVSLGAVRALPTVQRPSAFCLELEVGRNQVCQWIQAWRTPLQKIAQARLDTRDPLPHITIARPRRQAGETARRQGLAWLDTLQVPAVTMRVDRLVLYTWAERREQRLFRRVSETRWEA